MMFQGHMCFRLCVIQAAVVHSLFSAPKLLFEANPVRQGGQYTYATGTTVELNCTIAVPGLNSSVLVLQGCQSHLPAKRNSTNTIIYVIKNGGSRNSGVYRCCIGQCDEGFSFTSNSRSLAISFGPLPPKPKNFSCVSDNFMSLKCRWDVSGTNNTSNFWISRFIYDRYVSGSCQNTSTSSHQFPCACSNIALRTGINEMKPLMCSMKSGIHKQGPFFQFKNYWIQVWGYNPFGDVFWNYSVFTDTSIVKLPPVSILHADARNSSSIQVVWDLRSTIQIDITFEVAIRNLRSRDQRQSFQNITTTTKMASLENLRPFTNYSVQVRSRPNGGCYWSDSRSVNVTTMEDSPSSAPVSTPGAYSRISCEESMDCVWLYWKPIEELSRNGIITKYIINSSSTRHQSTIKQPDPKKDTFSSQLQWSDKGADHDIFIRGQTSKGPSPTYHLHVPNDTKAPKKPRWVVVEVLNTSCETYQITWPAQSCDYSPNDSLTIFWCLGVSKRSHVNCKAALDWVVLPPNTTMYTVSPHTDKNVSTILSWFFGVAVHKNNSSSGITWNKCIFTFNGGASKPVSLFASPVNLTYVEVSWHFSYCDTTQVQGKPEEYLVAYNKVQPGVVSNCTGGLHKSEPASFDSNSMFLTDLDYNVNYQVCMRIKTRVGFSPYSDPVQVEMKPPAADSNVEVIIGVSVSFGIVVIIFTVCMVKKRKTLFSSCTKLKIDLSLLHEEQKKGNLYGVSNATYTHFAETLKVSSFDSPSKHSGSYGYSQTVNDKICKSSGFLDLSVSSSMTGDGIINDEGSDVSSREAMHTVEQCCDQGQVARYRIQYDSGFLSHDLNKDSVVGMSLHPDVPMTLCVKNDMLSKQCNLPIIQESSDMGDYAVFQTQETETSKDVICKQHSKTSDYVVHSDIYQLADEYSVFSEQLAETKIKKAETLIISGGDDNDDDVDDDDVDYDDNDGDIDDDGKSDNNDGKGDQVVGYVLRMHCSESGAERQADFRGLPSTDYVSCDQWSDNNSQFT